MAKGKAKINSTVSVAPPQLRSLRSRKRGCPSDEISDPEDASVTLHHQDTAVDETLLQCRQSPLQQSIMISSQQHEAAEQACPTKQDPDTEEQNKATNVSLKNVTAKAFKEQDKTAVTDINNDSQLEGRGVNADDGGDKSGKDTEEITAEECNGSPSQTCSDQVQVLLLVSADGGCMGEEENPQSNSERNQEEHSNECITDEIPKDAAAGLPAKKKRRMGVCGLTERERSHFLQMQKCENAQNGLERVDQQICDNAADLAAQEEIISSPPSSSSLSVPAGSAKDRSRAETKVECSHRGGDDRAETGVPVAASDGACAECDPGCSEAKSLEVEGGKEPQQTGDTKLEPPAEVEEKLLGNQEQQELEGRTAAKPEEQMKEDGSAVADQSPAVTVDSNPTQNEETVNRDAPLLVNDDERKGDAEDGKAGASSRGSQSGGAKVLELCEAAGTPGGSKRKDSSGCDDEPAAGPSVNAVPPETRDTTDPFGSGYMDYVSDSQLNTIALIEEEAIQKQPDSPDCHEDATDLICGLIRELSSLNRKVMAAHRELENLRRSSKSARSSVR